jgi:hypothetical protein
LLSTGLSVEVGFSSTLVLSLDTGRTMGSKEDTELPLVLLFLLSRDRKIGTKSSSSCRVGSFGIDFFLLEEVRFDFLLELLLSLLLDFDDFFEDFLDDLDDEGDKSGVNAVGIVLVVGADDPIASDGESEG